jgi:hypothetical protein
VADDELRQLADRRILGDETVNRFAKRCAGNAASRSCA